jgi:hydroxymethylglutaryl-CoA synthase
MMKTALRWERPLCSIASGARIKIRTVCFSPPQPAPTNQEKQGAAIIASATDCRRESRTADFTNSLRAATIALQSALEEAKPGERILFANYGDGGDVFALRVTADIARIQARPSVQKMLARKKRIDYGMYLNWRGMMPVEAPSLPSRAEPSLANRWRERRAISALHGVRCRKCGTPQFHPIGQTIRICLACQAKDDFDDYRFADKKGKLFSYAVDQRQPTKKPPGLNGVVDFEGGGRLICEMTDYELDKVGIGMPVEMTYRRMSQGKGIINYFWKARPVID